jgi:ABC-type multidrug transport system ATPase subunit
MTAPPARLSIEGVSKSYGPTSVLRDLDLIVEAGSVVAVTGHNGSGKSTLLRCIAGLSSHRGTILVDGISPESARARIGYLPQSVGFAPWASVGEALAFFGRLRRAEPGSHPFEADFLPDPALPIRFLSGGQQQRVALAIALLGEPDLVLLDEPAASLDDAGRTVLESAVSQVAVRGASVLVATPRADDLGRLFDRVVGLTEGRLESRPESIVTPLKVVSP